MSVVRLPARYAPELSLLGSGGFGAVYRTEDRVRGVPVAVKVPFGAESKKKARAVLLELRAGAALRHPGFVQILDADLDPDGVPFLVMELAEAGPLEALTRDGAVPWSQAAPLVRELLRALAYAHAHGLVHRDVKLDNVLLTFGPEGALSARLSDFGLTKVEGGGGFQSTRLMAGTIPYMAPEAFEDDAALIHPGVDLYAMGVLIYLLLAGRTPWEQADFALIAAKLDGRHRALAASDTVPEQVARVVNRLLDADPRARPVLAADVLAELFLGKSHGSGFPGAIRETPAPLPPEPPAEDSVPVLIGAVPPALAVVREPLLVGRSEERATLWSLARRAGSEPLGLVLSGPSGTGRSRLSRWLSATMEQGGFARTLALRIEPGRPPFEAAALALRRLLVLGRAQGTDLRGRLHAWFRGREAREDDVEALASWLDPGSGSAVSDPREAAAARVALIERILRIEARRGLVVCRIEEVGAGASDLAARLLRSARAQPYGLLLVYEAQGETVPEPLADWAQLPVGPLSERDLESLLADLAVEEAQAPLLARRARGNAALAVESARLLASGRGGLISAGSSGATEVVDERRGVESSSGTAPIPPAQIALLRLQGFCEEASATSSARRRRLLGLLALLPRPCPRERMLAVWGGAAEELDPILDEACVSGLLLRDQEGGVAFAGGPMAEAALVLLDEGEEAEALRRRCAEELEAAGPGGLRLAARLRVELGEVDAALALLVEAGQALAREDAHAAGEVWEEALQLLGQRPAADLLRVRVVLGAAQTARDLGNVDLAEARLGAIDRSCLSGADRALWHELRSAVCALRAELVEAQAEAEQALAGFEAVGDLAGAARARLLVGDALARSGDREAAVAVFDRALQSVGPASSRSELWTRWLRARCLRGLGRSGEAEEELGRVLELARTLNVPLVFGGAERELGNLALRQGRAEQADALFRRSAERLEAAGLKGEAAVTRISLGELARARGALDVARDEYAAAFSVTRAYGMTSEVLVSLINLGIVELALGRGRRSGRRLEEIDRLLPPAQPHGLRPYIESLRLACATEAEDWETAEDVLDALLDEPIVPDPDLLFLLEHSAQRAVGRGARSFAADAWDRALRIAGALGDAGAEARVRAAMAG